MCLGHSEVDDYHAQWLLEINTTTTIDENDTIQVLQPIVCANLNTLINRVYPRIGNPGVKED